MSHTHGIRTKRVEIGDKIVLPVEGGFRPKTATAQGVLVSYLGRDTEPLFLPLEVLRAMLAQFEESSSATAYEPPQIQPISALAVLGFLPPTIQLRCNGLQIWAIAMRRGAAPSAEDTRIVELCFDALAAEVACKIETNIPRDWIKQGRAAYYLTATFTEVISAEARVRLIKLIADHRMMPVTK